MSLVGDIIMQLRRRIPDAPNVGFNPILIATPISDPAGNLPSLAALNYFFVGTQFNQWGESMGSAEVMVNVQAPNNAIQVTFVNVGYNLRLYSGENPNGEINVATLVLPGGAMGIHNMYFGLNSSDPRVANYTGSQGRPPTRSTLFLPDSDGNFIGASTAYELLNTALKEMVRIAGGIIDVTGVQSQINQSMYRLASPFYQFVNAWFDGYPMDIVPRSFMYLRNSAAGFSGILSYEQDGPQSVIQVWPQSNRTGGVSTLSASMDVDDNSFTTFSGNGFLSIGLAQIDDEIVAYSQASQSGLFQGVTRGMGGTEPATHNVQAPVTELNIRLSGYRMCETYDVGQSTNTIMVPQAWETPLVLHMLSEVRSMEQDEAAAKALLGDFVQMADKISKQSRMGKMKPRQIPIWGQNSTDARNVNGIGFGWLIN